MAHIGVLKVLEELKIPIDCIAGTSMGAVVGGLYASGMTAAQIDATMRSVDWQEAFRDAPPRRDLAFRRKQDDRNFLVRLPLGLKHGHILLPKGFIQGQKLQETLRQLTLPFSNSTDFDRLPTPFRAVATDLGHRQGRAAGQGRPVDRDAREHLGARACSRRSNIRDGCWSTAASRRTCPSTWRAPCTPTS